MDNKKPICSECSSHRMYIIYCPTYFALTLSQKYTPLPNDCVPYVETKPDFEFKYSNHPEWKYLSLVPKVSQDKNLANLHLKTKSLL